MDFYLSEDNCYQRLENEFKKYGKLIFCVDFDDTIYDFHKLGRSYDCIITLLKRWEPYSEVIIFTGNKEDKYPMIEEYMKNIGVKYKGINCDGIHGTCAEYVAIGSAIADGQKQFDTIVAVHDHVKNFVIPPCGNCRQMLFEYCSDGYDRRGKQTQYYKISCHINLSVSFPPRQAYFLPLCPLPTLRD